MGDAVNLASRLEGANKYFGTDILASDATVSLCGETCAWREIDAIRVKGRAQAVRVFEPWPSPGTKPPCSGTQGRLRRGAGGLAPA